MSDMVSGWLSTDQQVSSRIWGRRPSASEIKKTRLQKDDGVSRQVSGAAGRLYAAQIA